MLKIASVYFESDGITYDSICEIPDVKVGDRVIVVGYMGKREGEVREIQKTNLSKNSLPLDGYTWVDRKV